LSTNLQYTFCHLIPRKFVSRVSFVYMILTKVCDFVSFDHNLRNNVCGVWFVCMIFDVCAFVGFNSVGRQSNIIYHQNKTKILDTHWSWTR
jgi:hypothetical protein